jgi:hypothetical protein
MSGATGDEVDSDPDNLPIESECDFLQAGKAERNASSSAYNCISA